MKVIADSGSSKTDWLFLDKPETINIQTPGINPFFQNTKEIFEKQQKFFDQIISSKVEEVHFYGAGCIKGKTNSTVEEALKVIFSNAKIFVEDDMLGAARSVLGNNKGIACILGTGANSCLYNGNQIIDKVPTLGFILGDEGSGAYLGKLFLNDYFKRAIPTDLKEQADKELKLDMPDVLAAVYKGEYPSRYLAQFSKFLNEKINHPYAQNLIKRSFNDFISKNIERYSDYKKLTVNFVGSIAFYYSNLLKEVASHKGITIGKIIEKPIQGLKEFHSNS